MVYKTPMLQQYQAIKVQYPDCLLFFRLGDFYELFGDDAKIGSEVLHITLTARDKGSDGKIPMCGVPFHAAENYIARLVQAGYKVAICEQVSDPATAGGKGLVKREVVRVVTAGTLLRDESLTDSASQYLMSLVVEPKYVGGAVADLSTGQFFAFEFSGKSNEIIPLLMSHFAPREVVVSRAIYDDHATMQLIRQERTVNVTCAHDWLIYIKDAEKLVKDHFQVSNLAAFGIDKKNLAIKGAAALLGYLKYTQKGSVAHITSLQEFHFTGHLVLDQTTLRHLEIIRTAEGEVGGSLYSAVNRTVTSAGQRLLQDWLLHPLTDVSQITARQDAVTELISRPDFVQQLREVVGQLSDIERLVGRLSVGLGSPRDLRRLVDTLLHCQTVIIPMLSGVKSERLQYLAQPLDAPVVTWINRASEQLIAEAKPTIDEGYIFITGFHPELDQLRAMTSGNQTWLKEYEATERLRTGIAKLKVVYSRAFGYAIEITKSNKGQAPADYIPRQTLVNADRYTTQVLAEYEQKAVTALDQMIALEKQLFNQTIHELIAWASSINALASRIAELDVLISFATIAREYNFARPTITNTTEIHIMNGRHPVIEQIADADFIPNNTELSSTKSLQLITGPNMAGKSTYIRQVALITLLAHTGSFVPAKLATIGVTDRIFTRIGAHDNLRAGQSTFMVEMVETAHILHNITERSLVIFDEVGRGTSPEDGFALAWAIAEALSQSKSLVLFATHFHGLKDLAQSCLTLFNSHLAVAVDKQDLIFLRKIVDGPTDESYGIVVADKAGIPKSIISRAKQLALAQESKGIRKISTDQLPLLAIQPQTSSIEAELQELNINELTPLQALEFLAEIKNRLTK